MSVVRVEGLPDMEPFAYQEIVTPTASPNRLTAGDIQKDALSSSFWRKTIKIRTALVHRSFPPRVS